MVLLYLGFLDVDLWVTVQFWIGFVYADVVVIASGDVKKIHSIGR